MKYIMVTHWDNHWNRLRNNRTLFTKTMFRGQMNERKLIDQTETIFIKRDRESRNLEKCWHGKVYNFKKGSYRDLEAIYFSVKIDKEIACPIEYLDHVEGWHCEDVPAIVNTEKIKQDNGSAVFPPHVTLAWLFRNIPIKLWVTIFSFLFASFTFGIWVSGVPWIKDKLRYIPGYKVNLILPPETSKHIEEEITKLIEAHNVRLLILNEKLLYEEKLGGDHTIYPTDREQHVKAAERIKEIIKEENQNFQNELKSLKSFFEK